MAVPEADAVAEVGSTIAEAVVAVEDVVDMVGGVALVVAIPITEVNKMEVVMVMAVAMAIKVMVNSKVDMGIMWDIHKGMETNSSKDGILGFNHTETS